MEFKFDANQDFQNQAIESVVKLFEGQPYIDVEMQFGRSGYIAAVPNMLELSEDDLLSNVKEVQEQNNLPIDESLKYIDEIIDTEDSHESIRFLNFSVEMETGTGKTYVYLRTILELFRRYGFRKFIIIVPSIPIREGVFKTLQITEKHLRGLYENVPYRYYIYDSAKISEIYKFSTADSIEIMIMTIDSFNKDTNIIHQSTDHLQGETPIRLIQATKPILILDEPQNMESHLRKRALATLCPLFALRYSATHRDPYNLVYRLTPFEAYRCGIVKRIEVAGVEKIDEANQAFMRLDGIKSERNTLIAQLTVHRLMSNGTVKEKTIKFKPNDSLKEKTNLPDYDSFILDEINLGDNSISFTNGLELKLGESKGADKEAIFESQISYTIEQHLRKQKKLKPLGIKVLSLFFIDRVDNYVKKDGIIKILFNKCFNEIKVKYPEFLNVDSESVQAYYFAQRRTKSGEVIFEDSKTGEAERDKEAYDLIMREKERLLALDEPASFIFSHSALREGWDNPNIFQICTLNQTASEIKKRQEIGRGIRLCVNQSGERVSDEKFNILTVIANESYEHYVESLQSEIEEEYGREGLPPMPGNARCKKIMVHLRKERILRPEFKELWDRIKFKTRYNVTIDSESLISEVVSELEKVGVRSPRVAVTKGSVKVGNEDVFMPLQMSSTKTIIDLAGHYPLPNLVEIMVHMLEHTFPPTRLTRKTLLEIIKRTGNLQGAMDNPNEFAKITVNILKNKLTEQLVNGIKYEKINEWYEMTQFDFEVEKCIDYLIPAERSVYDYVITESDVERKFVEDLEKRDDVKLYLKLPSWFTVNTPIGSYNPDWGIILERRNEYGEPIEEQLLYLVRETKDNLDLSKLRSSEKQKIDCGIRHFCDALNVDFKVVTDAKELL